jgi:hypothetical protein
MHLKGVIAMFDFSEPGIAGYYVIEGTDMW